MKIFLIGAIMFGLIEIIRRRAQERTGEKFSPLLFPSLWFAYPGVLPEEKYQIIAAFVILIIVLG